jgi:hypothetical protein
MINRIIVIIFFLLFVREYLTASDEQSDSLQVSNSNITYGAEVGLYKKYVWRGITYNNGLVAQPNIWISYRDFTFEFWSNQTLHDIHSWIKRNEYDFYLSYNYQFHDIEFEPSFAYYIYPDQEDSPPTGEFILNVVYPIGDFKLTTNFTVDVIKYGGAYYVEPGISFENYLLETLKLSSSITLGYGSKKFNETYVGISMPTLSVATENIALSYYLADNIYIKPNIQFNQILDKDLYSYCGKYTNNIGVVIGMEF